MDTRTIALIKPVFLSGYCILLIWISKTIDVSYLGIAIIFPLIAWWYALAEVLHHSRRNIQINFNIFKITYILFISLIIIFWILASFNIKIDLDSDDFKNFKLVNIPIIIFGFALPIIAMVQGFLMSKLMLPEKEGGTLFGAIKLYFLLALFPVGIFILYKNYSIFINEHDAGDAS